MAAFGYSRALLITVMLLMLYAILPVSATAQKNAIDLSHVEAELKNVKLIYSLKSGQTFEQPPLSDSALALLEKALEETPGDPRAHLLLARLYERLDMRVLASEEYKKTVACLADAAAVATLAKQQLKIDNIWYAGRVLDAGIKRFPDDVELMALCANTLVVRNRPSEAKVLYQAVVQRQPERTGVRSALAQILLAEGKCEEAIKLADWDLRRDPHSIMAARVLGDGYIKCNQYGKALPYMKMAFAQMPLQPGVARDYGFLLYWQGDYEAALSPALIDICLHPERSNQPDSVWTVNLLRNVRPTDLTKTIANVSSLMHANATFHFALGSLLDEANLPDLAIEQYNAGLATAPYDVPALFRLGKDLELNDKNYAKALSLYQKAHSRDPNNLEISHYLSRLENRLKSRRTDLAWRLRDWFSNMSKTH